MKKASRALLILLLTVFFSVSVFAANMRTSPDISLMLNGSSALCSATVRNPGHEIDVTMELWCGSSMLRSWEKSGIGSVTLNKTATVSTGNTYTLTVYYSIDGVDYGPVETSSSN